MGGKTMSEALNAFEARSAKEIIARRTALELKNGMVVNLGIGLPTLIPQYLPSDIRVTIQSENGIIGLDKVQDDTRHPHITDASGKLAAVASGGAFIDSVTSFGLIRGGHVDVTILGSLQVDQEGSLANWMIPGNNIRLMQFDPWKENPRNGRRNGFAGRCSSGHCCDGTHGTRHS